MLVDSHCHLDFPDFTADIEQVLQRANDLNVGLMQTICTKISKFPDILKVAEHHHNIYCSVGNHPHEVDKEGVVPAAEIIALTKHPKVIGIGETGLDYFYGHSAKDQQIAAFREHIAAARITQLPIIIHTRDAEADTMQIITEEMQKGAFPGLIHCFTSTKELAQHVVDLGLYISISGIVTFKNAVELRETVKSLPLSRILVETDSPYLAPIPHRGKRNEPSFVTHTAEFLAQLFSISYKELEEVTTENFFALFTKAKR